MPVACDDCERYGRHMVGLTYLLLVVGLCMAVGTSSLALDGGLVLSAASVIEASDPRRTKQADEAHSTAQDALKPKRRATTAAERDQRDAVRRAAQACAPANPDAHACEQARRDSSAADDRLADARLALADANEAVIATGLVGASARENGGRALFFLLTLSTLSSLFGASFYVVNSVRGKRPRHAIAPPRERSADAEPSPVPVEPVSQAELLHHGEPFDGYAFWSGAFFRVGESVLFTLTFFTLIWSSDRRDGLVWLPALGLFVGMFVKTGEVVIFRLGTRVLCAADALLPGPVRASRSSSQPGEPASRTQDAASEQRLQ